MTNTTKTLLAILLIATAAFSGCVEMEDPVNANTLETLKILESTLNSPDPTQSMSAPLNIATSTPPAVPTKLELNIGETAMTQNVEVTVISAHEKYYYEWMGSRSVRSETADQGNTFIFVSVNMKNVGMDRKHLGSCYMSLTDSNGFRYDKTYMRGDCNELEGIQELYQNQQMEGIVLFEVPKDATGLKIQYDFGNLFSGTKIASWNICDMETG